MKMATMKFVLVSLVLFLCLLPTECELEYYRLVMQWPKSFCNTLERKEDPCRETSPEFSIRSLWGIDSSHKLIVCQQPWKSLDGALNKDVQKNLARYWRNLLLNWRDTEIWEVEWNHHGSCLFKDPTQYFQHALDSVMKINNRLGKPLEEVFADEGLLSSDRVMYSSEDFVSAIKKNAKLKASTHCNQDIHGNQQLNQISFCVNLQKQLINCTRP